MLTLWDLIEPVARRVKRKRPEATPTPSAPHTPPVHAQKTGAASRHTKTPTRRSASPSTTIKKKPSAQDTYDALVDEMLASHSIRVRKWRTSMSGIAWYVTYKDGRVVRLIEAPRPKGPMSVAVFLHEIGHHAIGFNTYKPRCLEEYHAWAWALREMESRGLNITDAVRYRMHASLWYAVQKAKRRGIKFVPPELEPFRDRPVKRRQTSQER